MNVYRISKCKFINDLKGTGAAAYGGRWHSKGIYVLYTSEAASLALLESVVHISNIAASGYCLLCLEIPDNNIKELKPDDLPEKWDENPPADLLKSIGDKFVRENKFLALKLPSVILPQESNYLLNPNHPDFINVTVLYSQPITIDVRLVG